MRYWDTPEVETMVQRLVDDLAVPFPGLASDLEGLSFDIRPREEELPSGRWDFREDRMLLTYGPHRDSTEQVLGISELLGHELWHRRSVRSLFWASPAGGRFLRPMRAEAQVHLEECLAGKHDGYGGDYMLDFEPEHGMLSPLHVAAEELVADRCGGAISGWVYDSFMGYQYLRLRRRGIPALAWRRS